MKQPVVLCYNLPEETFRKLRLAAMRFKIRVRSVKPCEYMLTLQELCEKPAMENGEIPQDAFTDEMLVMAYFPAALPGPFLQLTRKNGIPSIALKAILTPTNSEWNSITLHDEISKEREAILSGQGDVHSEG